MVRCQASDCRKAFVLGRILWELPRGSNHRYRIPPDCVIGGRLRKRNAPVNRYVALTQPDAQDETPGATDATGTDAP